MILRMSVGDVRDVRVFLTVVFGPNIHNNIEKVTIVNTLTSMTTLTASYLKDC